MELGSGFTELKPFGLGTSFQCFREMFRECS